MVLVFCFKKKKISTFLFYFIKVYVFETLKMEKPIVHNLAWGFEPTPSRLKVEVSSTVPVKLKKKK